jgi:hypothetical protein
MAGSVRRNRDDKLYDAMMWLKRHMDSCPMCMSARKGKTPRDMCDRGAMMALDAAMLYSDVMRLRIKAHSRPGDFVFACPDLAKHGKSYAVTAKPLMVNAIQDRLF